MDIHEYFGVLRRGWALVVLGLLVGIAGGFAANALQPRVYSATSREILTNSEATGDLTQSLQASNLAEGRIASYVLVATSGLVLQPVIDELKLDMTVRDLAGALTVVAPPNTLIVEITATAATPELAKSIANTVSSVFSDVVENQIENAVSPTVGATTTDDAGTETTTATPPVRIVNIERAALPTAPTSSNATLLLAVGAILGLALGLVGASLREALDRRIRSRRDVAAVTDRPVLGQVRADRGARSNALVMRTSPQSPIAESFRGLRASVEHVRARDAVNTFVVTAMEPRHGSSLVAANLALAIADTSTTVVVVDANLQAPSQASIFGVDAGPGLTDLLTSKTGLDRVLVPGPGENLWVVPIGGRPARSADLLATSRMRKLVAELGERFDVVIIDTASISTTTDAAVLGSSGAATLLVVAEGAATRPRLAEALGALAAGGSIPAGVVLNQLPRGGRSRRRGVAAPASVAPAAEALTVPPPVLTLPPTPAAPAAPVVAAAVPAPAAPETPAPAAVPETAPDAVPAADEPVAPVEEKVNDIPPINIAPPVVESTSGRSAARAARVAAKAAARAAAARPQQPVSRFAPKPPVALDALEIAAAERAARPSAVIKEVPVLDAPDESSNPVIDVPRGDTGERVSLTTPLLTPQPGDPTPEELAAIVANQFKDDVVYEIPTEAFGSFHMIDADAFAAIDNEPTVLPPFRNTEPEVAPGTLVIEPVDPLSTGSMFTITPSSTPHPPLTEENAAFVIDLLADDPIYAQPRFEDWALGGNAGAPVEPPVPESSDPADETEPEFDASVYDISVDTDAPVYEIPFVAVDAPAPVFEVPVAPAAAVAPEQPFVFDNAAPEVPEESQLPEERTVPRAFIAPENWPAPRLVADWQFAQPTTPWPAVPSEPAAEVAPPTAVVSEAVVPEVVVPEVVDVPAEPAPAVAAAQPEPAVYEIPVVAQLAPVVPVAVQPDVAPEPVVEVAPEQPLARVTALPSRERLARESYLLKSRELERAAQQRLRYEQDRLEARIREQLEADRRQLAGKLDELLEDTVMIPRKVADNS